MQSNRPNAKNGGPGGGDASIRPTQGGTTVPLLICVEVIPQVTGSKHGWGINRSIYSATENVTGTRPRRVEKRN